MVLHSFARMVVLRKRRMRSGFLHGWTCAIAMRSAAGASRRSQGRFAAVTGVRSQDSGVRSEDLPLTHADTLHITCIVVV